MDEKISEIQTYAKENSIPIMKDGGVEFICDFIKEHNLKRILEIGTAIGYSAIRFANVDNDVTVTSIEIDIDRVIKAKQNVSNFKLENRINIINADALQVKLEDSFDLIFIDAAKGQYVNFFEKFKNNLSENGYIISDNLSFHGMVEDLTLTHNISTKKLVRKIKKYIEFLEKNEEYETEFFPVGDRIAVTKRISK